LGIIIWENKQRGSSKSKSAPDLNFIIDWASENVILTKKPAMAVEVNFQYVYVPSQ